MVGVVLCGGESRRMGTDKGLLITNGQHWAGIALQKLSALDIPVVMSVNPLQVTGYQQSFRQAKCIVDVNGMDVHGPLLGLLSVHRQYPDEDLLVLACDMVAMQPGLLQQLLGVYALNNHKECYVFLNKNEPEPLCGIYTARLLQRAVQLLQAGQLQRHSMKYIIDISYSFLIPVEEKWAGCFQNFNQQEDLRDLSHPDS